MKELKRYPKTVRIWLFVGVAMVFVQILLGGITRLTGSGLSITKWEIVTGTLPPINALEWEEAFDLYKETPQYQKINEGMSLRAFKTIYFWEYLHRLWARSIGMVFLIPFIIFLVKRMIDKPLLVKLGKLVGLGLIVALFGWIMVASGLNDRPWVNAYKLTLHLNLGLLLYMYVLWVFLFATDPGRLVVRDNQIRRRIKAIGIVLAVQLLLGGVMSGMKAGLYYPTWPDMNGEIIPGVMFEVEQWTSKSFVAYDTQPLAPTVFQFLHRLFAYLLVVLVTVFFVKLKKKKTSVLLKQGNHFLFWSMVLQVALGIITVVNCVGRLPLTWGVLHQAGAIILLTAVVYMLYRTSRE